MQTLRKFVEKHDNYATWLGFKQALTTFLLRHCSQFCNKAFYNTSGCVFSIISVPSHICCFKCFKCIVRKSKILFYLIFVLFVSLSQQLY